METRPLQKPEIGMHVFLEEDGLMIEVSNVDETGFDFWVFNGCWSGRLENGEVSVNDGLLRIDRTGQSRAIKSTPMEVVSVTNEEFDVWYMHNARYEPPKVDEAPDEMDIPL